jgi:sulfur transfer complex TusBCD TusB component (DsrH family)
LQVLSPQDGAAVKTPQVLVVGTSTPGAVVTVNDDIIEVGADGKFQSTVALVQGKNVVEIVASDDQGNQQNIELNVIYQP